MFGSECAPGIHDSRWLVASSIAVFSHPTHDLVALFGLDCLSRDRRHICHWRREIDGRLACHWQPDNRSNPVALTTTQKPPAHGEALCSRPICSNRRATALSWMNPRSATLAVHLAPFALVTSLRLPVGGCVCGRWSRSSGRVSSSWSAITMLVPSAPYTQAGQDYGTSLLWTLLLLVPVLYVNQKWCCASGPSPGSAMPR